LLQNQIYLYLCSEDFMSKLKEKANFNFTAAEKLIELNLYAPSIHCSYYSCFQLMKFTIKDFFGKDYATLSQEIRNSNLNTHAYIINYICKEIKNNCSLPEFGKFNRKIKDLKNFRENSDYENIEITIDESQKALEFASEIRKQLSNIF